MVKLGDLTIDDFVGDLGSRYASYARNRMLDERTRQEVIIPVHENSQVRESLQQMVDQLCTFYLTVSDEERDHVRKLAEPHHSLHQGLIDHIGWTCQRIKSPADSEWLRRGLAAVSIENNLLDYRDTYNALGALYLVGVRAGIDPSPYFGEAGQLSSSGTNPTTKSPMRDFLANFEQTEYFATSVQPKLPLR
jgi:hypothetical protein